MDIVRGKAKKRMLIFSTAFYPFVGGAEVAIKEITKRLDRRYEFDLITAKLDSKLPSYEKVDNVNVFRIGTGKPLWDKILLPFRGGYLAYKLNRERTYYVYWGMMVTFATGAAFIGNIINGVMRKPKVPVVITLQEGDSEAHLKYRWVGLIALSWRLAMFQTDVLTAISNFLLNRAKKNGYRKESFLVPNGVDVKLFSERIPQQVRNELREKLGKKDGDVYLVTAGRLTYKNAVDDIIAALPRLPHNVQLLIIGKGDEGPKLQKQANALGVAHRVKFLGFMAYADIPKYLSISEIFIRPSRSEGFGNSFIEAMAARIPVIATPVGGIVDFIDDMETGVFCSPDNPQSIAKAVTLISQDRTLRERLVSKAYDRVKDRYSWDHVALEMGRVFDSVEVLA